MKQYRTAIIAFVLIVCAVAAFFLIRELQPEEPADPTDSIQGDSVSAFPFAQDPATKTDIVGFTCQYGDTKIELVKQQQWTCPTYPDIDLIEKNVTNLVNRLYTYQGAAAFEGTVTEAVQQDFGLTGDEKIVITMKDGTQYTAVFGGFNTDETACYVWLSGADAIYLYATAFKEAMLINKADLISTTVFDFADAGQITRIAITKGEQEFARFSATLSGVVGEARTWQMTYPLTREGKTSSVESLLSALTAITIDDLAVADCDHLDEYGLAPAAYSVTLSAPGQTVSIHLGNQSPDGEKYYFTVDDGDDVYLVQAASVTFKDVAVTNYMETTVFMVDYKELDQVDIRLGEEHHTLRYEFGEENEETFYFDGHCVTDSAANYRDEFTDVLFSLYLLAIENVAPTEAPASPENVLCEIQFKQTDGTLTTVTCTKRDDTTMYYYLNGQYVGGYGPQYLLTSDAAHDGVRGNLDAMLACLKLQ